MDTYFDFYGVRIKVVSDDFDLVNNIRRDFSYFSVLGGQFDILFVIYNKEIPYDKVPPLKASLYKDNAICYDDKHVRYIDYHGRALSIYDFINNKIEIYSQDKDFLWELTYLAILSMIGEALDKKGIHRIHALGLSINEKAILCVLPMGAGKTTLGLRLLKEEKIKLLSDDMPLITKDGKILPFPIRIGVDRREKLDIPERYLRVFPRSKYGAKILIDIEYFRNKIAKPSRPAIILIGERIFSNNLRIEKIPKRKVIMPFFINGVFGLGLPQLIEYFLRSNIKDIFFKIKIGFSRLFVSLRIIWKSKIYRLLIGTDIDKNINRVLAFLNF